MHCNFTQTNVTEIHFALVQTYDVTLVLSNCVCSRIFHLEKMEKQCQKNGIGKCKSERGTHDNAEKMENKMQIEKGQTLQMEETCK